LVTEESVSTAVVKRRVLAPPKVVTPVPPWFTPTVPEDVKFLLPSVKTTLLAVKSEKLTVPEE
jgi:hypothetical protein